VTSSLNNTNAIRGDALATTGVQYGVEGLSYSNNGFGVGGFILAPGGGYGVAGTY
jgi:hypothetical protein